MSCGVGPRQGSDPTLLWFWSKLAAIAPIRPLDWEPPYATGMALKRQKKKKKKKERKKRKERKTFEEFLLWLSGNEPNWHS